MGPINFGISFSHGYAEWLFQGMRTPEAVLEELAGNLGVQHYRLGLYWDRVQAAGPDAFHDDLAWQLDILERHQAHTVIVNLGRKVIRWPEYHVPDWAKLLPEAALKERLLQYLQTVVERYATDPRITHWQVENEPFFRFGDGKPFSDQANFLDQEIAVVRAADTLKRPIIVTQSGDSGNWNKAAVHSDILGVSFYGISHHRWIGYYTHHNGRPERWQKKIARLGKPVWMTEVQAEPWGNKDVRSMSYEESSRSMDVERFRRHTDFVMAAGFDQIFFWGAEWWLYMKDQGHPAMWEAAREIIRPTH